MPQAFRPADGWKYVEGAVNCAFYEVSSARVIHLGQKMSQLIRSLARGQPLDLALDVIPGTEREEILKIIAGMPCLTEASGPAGRWPAAKTENPTGPIRLRGAFLELTVACNFRCRHCYAEAGSPSTEGEYSTREWMEVCDKLRAEGVEGVTLTGGEPMFRKDFCEILMHADQVFDGQVTVLTNAALIDETICDALHECKTRISISFYSHDADRADRMTGVPGSWQQVVGALELLLKHQVTFTVNVVLSPDTRPDLPDIRSFLVSQGVDQSMIMANPVLPAGRGCAAKADMKLLQSDFPHRPFQSMAFNASGGLDCSTCWKAQLTVAPTGCLLFCNMLRDMPIGELKTNSLSEIVASERCQSMWGVTLDDIEECKECELRFACYDCRAAPFLLTGDLYRRNPLCLYDPIKGEWSMATHSWFRSSADPDFRPKARDGFVSKPSGDEVLFYDEDGKNAFSLNRVAARIWSLCDGSRTIEDIARLLFEEFEVDMNRLVKDVNAAVDYMALQGLLE
jgi:radical SAM protein with 4Fe4S-binding SPASM domain